MEVASMTIAATDQRPISLEDHGDVTQRLLDSAAELSYDPQKDLDWESPLPEDCYGLNPEWSTLYGTPLWQEMTTEQKIRLTRHEVCSIMSVGIWFEMILQQMVLRDQYVKNPANSEFQFALTEIADECRHSIMFARACEKMGVRSYFPTRSAIELGRGFKTLATAENAYGGILVAEEVLDVMQRDWMRGENVLPIVRGTSKIHVVEESRHMKFARQEIRESVEGASTARRRASALVISIVAAVIVKNMVSDKVYANAGLPAERAKREARNNEHYKTMLRSSCRHLMEFLSDAGLLTRPAMAVYKRVNMV
jgi:hypothetical protein